MFSPYLRLLLFLSINSRFRRYCKEYTKGCEIVRAYTRSRNWRKMRARTKGFMQNKECKYKVVRVLTLWEGWRWVDDAYKMDVVQCMHPRRTPGFSSNIREGIKKYEGKILKTRPLNMCAPISVLALFSSFVLRYLPFRIFQYSCSFSSSIPLLPFPVYSASVLTVASAASRSDRTSLETTRNYV